jgi:peroxiredoxin
MAKTASKMLPLGTRAPSFKLKDTEGKIIDFDSFKNSRGYLVMFICNHCPYVKHIADELSQVTAEYEKKGIAVFGINSNDVVNYSEDSFDNMILEKKERRYTFPYMLDESQAVAKSYDAACTPDFFLFDAHKNLAYRGQFDDSRPGGNVHVTGKDLKAAMDAVLLGKPCATDQKPSLGCNIKWK